MNEEHMEMNKLRVGISSGGSNSQAEQCQVPLDLGTQGKEGAPGMLGPFPSLTVPESIITPAWGVIIEGVRSSWTRAPVALEPL